MNTLKLITLISLISLGGCATTQYASQQQDISKVSTYELINQGLGYAYLQSTLWSGPGKAGEHAAIVAELRRRHPNWDWPRMEQSQIATGMTPNEVLIAWGHPARKNSHSGSYGTRSQWVYYRAFGARQYVYFRDGKVDGFGDS